jgi:outer membrane protein assembly factor BamB
MADVHILTETPRHMITRIAIVLATAFGIAAGLTPSAQAPVGIAIGDWPEMRGPNRDGRSLETGLPDTWALNGENFLWRVPHGGRSAPVVFGNRVYVQNPAGRGADLQERVMALDADTGRTIWEHRFNVFQSDVPPHRIAWASPAVDPETGNVYALGANAKVVALDPNGQPLWDYSLAENWAAFTTHGGRTTSPVVDGDLVIVNSAISNWGAYAGRSQRFVAFDKRTGEIVYVSSPGGRPYDTNYSYPTIATINGTRLLIAGHGDGGVHAVKPQTGEKVWSFIATKRAVNTSPLVVDGRVFVSHGDENLTSNVMGMLAAIDGSRSGTIADAVWVVPGPELGYSSPVTDGTRLYQLDNSSTLRAFNLADGAELWSQRLGLLQKAPAVLADGKIYVGTESGEFFIVRPHADRAEVLSKVDLPDSTASCCGSEGTPEQILAGAAVSRGRVFFVSSDAVYAIGSKQATSPSGVAAAAPPRMGSGAPAHVQIVPAESVVSPGESISFRARLFDAQGRFLRESPAAWSLANLRGTIDNGAFAVASDPVEQAGVVTGTVEGLKGEARVRVVRPLPWTEDFEGYTDGQIPPGWVNTVPGRLLVATLDGQKVLQKEPLDTIFARTRSYIGPTDWSNYTIAADVRARERRRQMASIGLTAQRYTLVLSGTTRQLKLEPWEPETTRSVLVPFAWEPDTWYRMKLRVDNEPNGAVRARGKAWKVGDPEPDAWAIDQVDPIGNRQGAPGLFFGAPFGAYLDNLTLSRNE